MACLNPIIFLIIENSSFKRFWQDVNVEYEPRGLMHMVDSETTCLLSNLEEGCKNFPRCDRPLSVDSSVRPRSSRMQEGRTWTAERDRRPRDLKRL